MHGIAVDFHEQFRVVPFAAHPNPTSTQQKSILIQQRSTLTQLVLRVLV